MYEFIFQYKAVEYFVLLILWKIKVLWSEIAFYYDFN